jgi:hypothetical protein
MRGESRFLGNHLPLGKLFPSQSSALCDLVLLVIIQPTFLLQSPLNVNLEYVSITIMSKGGKLEHNTLHDLYFVSSRNVCNIRPLDVPFVHKHAHFTHESKASSSGSKISKLVCATPP